MTTKNLQSAAPTMPVTAPQLSDNAVLFITLGVCYCWTAYLVATKDREAHLTVTKNDFKLDASLSQPAAA